MGAPTGPAGRSLVCDLHWAQPGLPMLSDLGSRAGSQGSVLLYPLPVPVGTKAHGSSVSGAVHLLGPACTSELSSEPQPSQVGQGWGGVRGLCLDGKAQSWAPPGPERTRPPSHSCRARLLSRPRQGCLGLRDRRCPPSCCTGASPWPGGVSGMVCGELQMTASPSTRAGCAGESPKRHSSSSSSLRAGRGLTISCTCGRTRLA